MADVKALVKAGVSDDLVISQIRNSRTVYHLGTADIIDLKNSGVSERIIDFMINTPTQVQSAASGRRGGGSRRRRRWSNRSSWLRVRTTSGWEARGSGSGTAGSGTPAIGTGRCIPAGDEPVGASAVARKVQAIPQGGAGARPDLYVRLHFGAWLNIMARCATASSPHLGLVKRLNHRRRQRPAPSFRSSA